MSARLYLDWNASAPLRAEARDAMIAAMDLVGNASSIHAEGRAVRGLVEKARGQIASALGADGADIVFTSSATESAALALAGRDLACAAVEHDAVKSWCRPVLSVDETGRIDVTDPAQSTAQLANSETGIVQDLPAGLAVSDLTQAFGKMPFAFNWLGCDMGLVSAHKLGGPKGIGALALKRSLDVTAQIRGGGQEMGRRAGTENVIGIAGFAAAAEAAMRDLANGVWDEVAEIRNTCEQALEAECPGIILVAKDRPRLPNTISLVAPGWKGETQVMAMDLQGFAVSAGSACSSGKVSSSGVLRAMGFDATAAGNALRVSMGPGIDRDDALRFAAAYAKAWKRAGERMKQAGADLPK
ncbi:cysteine desulfurase family protein [Pararhodobacter zhoushanensis]|uniref:cysteine desulfurase family protein n=1 Tax=Pararhodobacter zhoushanensis TaxID=2479545 RepID=UPI000F8F5605|nr:aminotransferase class V-fold PLP-dependent enzyme [Pararhodobacter zhoushanensis]